jgi:SAM-dependent methyltransferase
MIPFTDNSAHITDDFCTERRIHETIEFIRRTHGKGWNALDIGESNHMAMMIQAVFAFDIDHTAGDLNGDNWKSVGDEFPYDMAFCFEVFEHVMNPLHLLECIRWMLKDGGVLYLSTPLHNRFGFYFNETCHFAEYKESSLRTVVEYAGFKITDYHQFKSIPFWQGMKQGGGLFRTALRVSSQRTQILRAVKV